jgi:hypothetical protein
LQPGKHNIRIVIGDDFLQTFTMSTQASDGTITPMNLTGWTAQASLTELADGSSYPMVATIVNAALGQVSISLARAYTASMQKNNANWYLALTSPAALLQTYLAGNALPLTRGGFT